jgi:hypothetical protein
MKGNFLMKYRKVGTGALMFIFTVKGSATELAQYKETQGENLRLDEAGNPLFYVQAYNPDGTLKNIGKTINIVRTGGDNPRYVWDDSDMLFNALQKANEILPEKLAIGLAEQMLNQRKASTVPTIAPSGSTAIPAASENAVVQQLEGQESLGA